jgi:hypothetical protein
MNQQLLLVLHLPQASVNYSCGASVTNCSWWTPVVNSSNKLLWRSSYSRLLCQTPIPKLLSRPALADSHDHDQTAMTINPCCLYNLGDQLLPIVGLFVATIYACLQTVTKLQQFPIVAVARLPCLQNCWEKFSCIRCLAIALFYLK